MSDVLVVDRSDGVVTLTMNRPDALNSLNGELEDALRDILPTLAAESSCRAIVLTGAGRGFCAGQDLAEHLATLDSGTSDVMAVLRERLHPIAWSLAAMPKPVVAAVRGVAAGAGASFAFLADFRVGGPRTTFMLAFAKVGLAGDSGASWILPRLVGHAKATELLLLADPVNAAEAARLGLLTELVDDDEQVLPRAQELAARLAAGPTVAYAQIKRELLHSAAAALPDALRIELEAQQIAAATTDHREATQSFVRKERFVFKGF